jgi:hypothetical protein
MFAMSSGLVEWELWHEVVMQWCLGFFYLFSSYIWHVQNESWHEVVIAWGRSNLFSEEMIVGIGLAGVAGVIV